MTTITKKTTLLPKPGPTITSVRGNADAPGVYTNGSMPMIDGTLLDTFDKDVGDTLKFNYTNDAGEPIEEDRTSLVASCATGLEVRTSISAKVGTSLVAQLTIGGKLLTGSATVQT